MNVLKLNQVFVHMKKKNILVSSLHKPKTWPQELVLGQGQWPYRKRILYPFYMFQVFWCVLKIFSSATALNLIHTHAHSNLLPQHMALINTRTSDIGYHSVIPPSSQSVQNTLSPCLRHVHLGEWVHVWLYDTTHMYVCTHVLFLDTKACPCACPCLSKTHLCWIDFFLWKL